MFASVVCTRQVCVCTRHPVSIAMEQVLRRRIIQMRDIQKIDMREGVQRLEFVDRTDSPYGRRWRPFEEEEPNPCGKTYEDDSQIGEPCYNWRSTQSCPANETGRLWDMMLVRPVSGCYLTETTSFIGRYAIFSIWPVVSNQRESTAQMVLARQSRLLV